MDQTGEAGQGAGDLLLEVIDLSKDYGPVRAVAGLDFSVRRGEIVGLLGPNGAGKSTAMRVMVGYQVPSGGTIRLAGEDVFRAGAAAKQHLGYLPENPPLYLEMRVDEYLTMAGKLKGLGGDKLSGELGRTAEILGLAEVWRRPIGHLSRGFRQRVGLAQCLLGDPPLLILDEPATGLDPNQIADLRRLLLSWRARKGILLSTHILAEALMLCDRVLVLSRGRLVAEGDPQALAGDEAGPVETIIVVRGPGSDPLDGFEAGAALQARRDERGAWQTRDRQMVWRIEGALDQAARARLLAHLVAGEWDLLEWSAGLGALERSFRKLTLEEGDEREGGRG
ncbi:MAG: ABC transporter ATP-binding protein [Candidatus Eisenbacteria sp.]|nr:ABC transporter ATP-binding protein [Candidatus Eisenbacteria bacterium]